MIDFGQLENYKAQDVITFSYAGETYTLTPSAAEILDLQAVRIRAEQGKLEDFDPAWGVYIMTAPLFKSKFNPETVRFTGGILGKLQKEGIDFTTLDRLVTAVYVKFVNGDDVAKALMETGDLGKALQAKATAVENRNREIQKALGETTGDA